MLPAMPIVWIDDGRGPLGEPRAHSFSMGEAIEMVRMASAILARSQSGDATAAQQIQQIQAHAFDERSPERGRCALFLAIYAEIHARPLVAPQPMPPPPEATVPQVPQSAQAPVAAQAPATAAAPAPTVAGKPTCRRSTLAETAPGYHPPDFTCEECDAAAAAILEAHRKAKAGASATMGGP